VQFKGAMRLGRLSNLFFDKPTFTVYDASTGELYIQGVERQRGGAMFRTGKGVGGTKNRTTAQKLSICYTPFTVWWNCV